MEGDEIGASQQFVQLDLFDTHLLGLFFAQEGVIGHDFHLEAPRAVANDAADVARADDAQRLAGQLNAHKLRFFPFARVGRGRRFGDLPCHGEHHRDGVFGSGDHVAEGRVHDDHTLFRRGFLVDIVGADARAADHFEVRRIGEDLFRHLGGGADREAVIVADHFGQFVFVLAQIGLEINVDATVAKDLNGGFRQAVGDEYFGSHFCGPFQKYGGRGGAWDHAPAGMLWALIRR